MKDLKNSVIRHIAQAALKAGARFDRDCRGELEADFDMAERRIGRIEERLRMLEEISALRSSVDALQSQVAELEDRS